MSRGSISRILLKCSKQAKFHVTTPIFYPNAKPHLGHLYSSLLCDVTRRWYDLLSYKTLFTTGTDEHGLKIQLASEKQSYNTPHDFVEVLYKHFVDLDKKSQVNYSRFIRTTDPDHIENVKKLWRLCWENGYIYKGEHQGWYSISDETFYPESKVVELREGGGEIALKDTVIDSRRKYINTETRNEVLHQSETNYFFRLSAFQKKLIEYIEQNPQFIHPPNKRDQILHDLKENPLQDLSISRPASRLKWGIDVPNDSEQKVYVWFDALCNYLTSVGGIDAVKHNTRVSLAHSTLSTTENPRGWWENTTHLIGKDIAKFHTVYWPSFLMAADLPLPKQIVIHGHWLSNGVKMSKSLGNVVDPLLMISYYGCDSMRWYLLENSRLETDCDFVEGRLHGVRELLSSKWGNLINRCCGPKFNLARGVSTFNNRSPEELSQILTEGPTRKAFESLVSQLDELPGYLHDHFTQFDTSGPLKQIWSIINDTNTFVQLSEPWNKKGDEQDLIIYTAMEVARILSILSQPIIPELSGKFLDRIDVSKERRSLRFAELGADASYGQGSNVKGREVPISRIPLREK